MKCENMDEREIRDRVKDAVDYLAPNFDLKKSSITTLDVLIMSLPRHNYATFNDLAHILCFDLEQFLYDTSQTDCQNDILNLICGEEAAHYLDLNSSGDIYKVILLESCKTARFVSETIGHYGGLIYSNKDINSCFFGLDARAPGVIGEAYKSADKIFETYRAERFRDIVQINNLIKRYEKIGELMGK